MLLIVIPDEDLKRMGIFDETGDIYAIEKELLYFRNDSESKKDRLHFKQESYHHRN
jgi:hypothetical protein